MQVDENYSKLFQEQEEAEIQKKGKKSTILKQKQDTLQQCFIQNQ